MSQIHIVFDGPPEHESGRFVEVEDEAGHGRKFGEWEQHGDDWHLVFDDPEQSLAAAQERIRELEGKVASLIGDYERKVQDFARETLRNDALEEMVRDDVMRLKNRELLDMTPDDGMVKRILSAYIDDSFFTDNTTGADPTNPVCILMNENPERRNALIRAAIRRIHTATASAACESGGKGER